MDRLGWLVGHSPPKHAYTCKVRTGVAASNKAQRVLFTEVRYFNPPDCDSRSGFLVELKVRLLAHRLLLVLLSTHKTQVILRTLQRSNSGSFLTMYTCKPL